MSNVTYQTGNPADDREYLEHMEKLVTDALEEDGFKPTRTLMSWILGGYRGSISLADLELFNRASSKLIVRDVNNEST